MVPKLANMTSGPEDGGASAQYQLVPDLTTVAKQEVPPTLIESSALRRWGMAPLASETATGRHSARAVGGAQEWAAWADRWHGTSALTRRARGAIRATLLKAGRWLEAEHAEAAGPARWTRQTCAAGIAALDRMQVGDYVQCTAGLKDRAGKPLEPATKAAQLSVVQTFFRDRQEWEWIPRRFDPQRALATPRSIAAMLGPAPPGDRRRYLGEADVGGPDLQEDDLPQPGPGPSILSSWSAPSP